MSLSKATIMGKPLEEAQKVLIMIHGRGADAESILSIAEYLDVKDFALVAPTAPGNTWYPYSFMAPQAQNDPSYSNSVNLLTNIYQELGKKGFKDDQIYWLGFSQGACLALECSTIYATRWGGVIAFTGGLIGETIDESKYSGDFKSTPIFIGSSDPDPHVPVSRVKETEKLLTKMGAAVQVKIYPGMPHTINEEEIEISKRMLSNQFS